MPNFLLEAMQAYQAASYSREPAMPRGMPHAPTLSFLSHLQMQRPSGVPLTGSALFLEQTPGAQAEDAAETAEAAPQASSSLPQRPASGGDLRALREQIQNGHTQPFPRNVQVAISKLEKAEAQAGQFGVQTPRARDAWKAGMDVLKNMPAASTASTEATTIEAPAFDPSQFDPGPEPASFATYYEKEAWLRQCRAFNAAKAIAEAQAVLGDSVLAASSGEGYPAPANIALALGVEAGVYDYEGTIRPLDQVYQSVQDRITAMQEMLATGQINRADTLMGDLHHDLNELRRWSHRLMGSSHLT